MEHLRRAWHADRGRLLLRTPGPVPLGLAYVLLVETDPTSELVVGLCSSNITRYFLDFASLNLLLCLATLHCTGYAPNLKGPPGASRNRIVRLPVRNSVPLTYKVQ